MSGEGSTGTERSARHRDGGVPGSYFRNGIAAVTLAEHHAILAAILDRDADGAAQSMRDASATVVGLSITA